MLHGFGNMAKNVYVPVLSCLKSMTRERQSVGVIFVTRNRLGEARARGGGGRTAMAELAAVRARPPQPPEDSSLRP